MGSSDRSNNSSSSGRILPPDIPAEYEGAMARWKQATKFLRTQYGRDYREDSYFYSYGLKTEVALRREEARTRMALAPGKDESSKNDQEIQEEGKKSRTRMVLASGMNGIDGYLGMYLQIQVMEHLVEKYPDCDFMFIAPINPYGMKEYQWTNNHNVDLSHNFNHGEFEPVRNEHYQRFRNYLYPDDTSSIEAQRTRVSLAFKDLSTEQGRKLLQKAIYGGQSIDEYGLFYAGYRGEEESRALKRILHIYLFLKGGSGNTFFIDLRGGFDKLGRVTYSTAFPRESERYNRLKSAVPTVVPLEESLHNVPGDLALYLADLPSPETERFTYLRMSYGTIPLMGDEGSSPITGFTTMVPVAGKSIHPDLPEVFKSGVLDIRRGIAREPDVEARSATRDAIQRWAATARAVRSLISCNIVHLYGASKEEEEFYRQEFRELFNPKDKAWMISPLEKVISNLISSGA